MDRQARVWLLAVAGVLLTVAAGCGGGAEVTGPSEVSGGVEAAAVAPLPVPARLRLVWGSIDNATIPVARFGPNAVALQIGTWDEDTSVYARWSRERGIVAIPYVEQVFTAPRGAWDAGWARVERWAEPLRREGVLVGYHVTDEWAYRGLSQAVRDEAVAYVRAKAPGMEVLNTEWVDTALHRDFRKPQGRWFGVNCYAYASRTPWHTRGCVETFERHPEWNLVVVPAFAGGNMAGPYDQAAWESMADRTGKSIAFWSWEQ